MNKQIKTAILSTTLAAPSIKATPCLDNVEKVVHIKFSNREAVNKKTAQREVEATNNFNFVGIAG